MLKTHRHKTLILTQYVKIVNLIHSVLKERDIYVAKLHGKQLPGEEDANLRLFRNNSKFLENDGLVATYKKCAEGVNLQEADCVIQFDVPESHAQDVQSEDRYVQFVVKV